MGGTAGYAALTFQNLLCPPTMALSSASPGRVNHASPGIASGQHGALVKYLCHLSSGLRVMAAKKPLKTHASLRGLGLVEETGSRVRVSAAATAARVAQVSRHPRAAAYSEQASWRRRL